MDWVKMKIYQNMWDTTKVGAEREIYTKTILSQETRKISNKQPIPTPKTSREGKTEPKIRRREINKE